MMSSYRHTAGKILIASLAAIAIANAGGNEAALSFPDSDLSVISESRWIAGGQPVTSWPLPLREICPEDSANSGADSTVAQVLCGKAKAAPDFRLTVNVGEYPLGRTHPFAVPFPGDSTGWIPMIVTAEQGNVWNHLPPVLDFQFHYDFSSWAHLFFEGGLRRDISAWDEDPLGGNVPLSTKEVDLNQPMLGYFHAENRWAAFTVGQFQVHWSPSPEYGLALSREVPYHDGALFTLKMAKLRYHLLISSLNPWLQGYPGGDTSNTNYPVGSEQWQQVNYPKIDEPNAHLLVYDDRIKTLIAHRLELPWGPFAVGLTELCIIGGKVPDFRDFDPFAIYHNQFKDGYDQTAVSVDAKVRLPYGFAALGEFISNGVHYAPTEPQAKNVSGFMGGIEHAWSRKEFVLLQTFHVIQTDPLLYHIQQPYNTLYSRTVLTSNNQDVGANPFVDKYVVDYPMGYARGGGCLDYRYAARLVGKRGEAVLRLEYLTQDGSNLQTPYVDLYDGSANTSADQTEAWRALLEGSRKLPQGITVHAGLGWQTVLYPARVPREEDYYPQGEFGLSWAFSTH